MQSEAIERGAERLVESERARRERRETAQPVRAGGRIAAADGARGEGVVSVDVAIAAFVAVSVELEQAAAAEVALDASDDGLEHGADLAGLEVTELDPRERVAVFIVVSAVEEDDVQMGIEPHVARRSLHGDDGACLCGARHRARGIEALDGRDEDPRERAEERAVLREPAPLKWEGQHSLPQCHFG